MCSLFWYRVKTKNRSDSAPTEFLFSLFLYNAVAAVFSSIWVTLLITLWYSGGLNLLPKNITNIKRIATEQLNDIKSKDISISSKGFYVDGLNYDILMLKMVYLTLTYMFFIFIHSLIIKYSITQVIHIIQVIDNSINIYLFCKLILCWYANFLYTILHIKFFISYISSWYHVIMHDPKFKFVYITLSEMGSRLPLNGKVREETWDIFKNYSFYDKPSNDKTKYLYIYSWYLEIVFIGYCSPNFFGNVFCNSWVRIPVLFKILNIVNLLILTPTWLIMLFLFYSYLPYVL